MIDSVFESNLNWSLANKLINIKELLDEVEHDNVNYQNRGLCYLPKPKDEADKRFL